MNSKARKQKWDTEPFRIDLHGAFVRRVDLSGASLVEANLARADATGASFRDADFDRANLDGTILVGADLTGARNLTTEQLSHAVLDETTALPDYIDRARLPTASGRG
ncbi:MAG: pentapeptide repeat-containing protein [Propylenella sp.]